MEAELESITPAELRTLNITDDPIHNKKVQVVFFMVYTNIFVLGLFGNILVCYVVFRNKAMQTVTNLFITNLALSDILLCVLAVPFTPLYTFLGKWVFGSVICHLVTYAQGASVYISTLTLTSIAIDRFFVIIYPFHPRMKLSTCIIVIVIIWLFSILVTLPYGVYMRHISIKLNATLDQTDANDTAIIEQYYCDENWPSEHWRRIFSSLTTTMQFVFPFIIMTFCYVCVSIKLSARSKPGAKSSKKEEADRERKRRTNRMLIAMVAIFLISWLPLNTINITCDFYQPISKWDYFLFSFFLVHAIAMSSTCYNPFLYAWLNENFRKEFKQVLPCFDTSIRIPNGGRVSNWKSERTHDCLETQQESLLPSSTQQSRRLSFGKERLDATMSLKAEGVEVEDILVPTSNIEAVYDSAAETVQFKTVSEEEPPPYEATVAAATTPTSE